MSHNDAANREVKIGDFIEVRAGGEWCIGDVVEINDDEAKVAWDDELNPQTRTIDDLHNDPTVTIHRNW